MSEQTTETPRQFIRRLIQQRAKAANLSIKDVLGKDKRSHVVAVRWGLIAEVHEKYRHISLLRLGDIFNVDHASVGHALKRKHRWELIGRALYRTERRCLRCGMLKITHHDDAREFPWTSWHDRDGKQVYYDGLTPPCLPRE